jgi:putative protease
MAKAKKRGAKKKSSKKKKAAKKKAGKKAVKRPVKKAPRPKLKKVLKTPAKAPVSPAQPPPIQGTFIGRVTHYFPHVNAAAIKMEQGTLQVGDQIYLKGHTTDFKQTVDSLQINHVSVPSVKVGDDVGILVKDRVREHDAVYKL